jgi:hypothetical protein
MKKKFLIIALSLISALCFSQDIVVFREKAPQITIKVIEISNSIIKYKKWENLKGPTYNLPVSSILLIKYANGSVEVFDDKYKPTQPDNKTAKISDSAKSKTQTANVYPSVKK